MTLGRTYEDLSKDAEDTYEKLKELTKKMEELSEIPEGREASKEEFDEAMEMLGGALREVVLNDDGVRETGLPVWRDWDNVFTGLQATENALESMQEQINILSQAKVKVPEIASEDTYKAFYETWECTSGVGDTLSVSDGWDSDSLIRVTITSDEGSEDVYMSKEGVDELILVLKEAVKNVS